MFSLHSLQRMPLPLALVALTVALSFPLTSPALAQNLLRLEVVPLEHGFEPRPPDVLSTLTLAGDQQIEFVAEPQGIGVIEVGPLDAPRVLPQLIGDGKVTAFEIYRRLTDEPVPAEIVDDHFRAVERLERQDTNPRELASAIAVQPVATASGELEDEWLCNYQEAFIGNSQWAQNWHFDHLSADQHAEDTYEYFEMQPGNKYTWSAGTSIERWLGACNGDRLATPNPSFNFFPEYLNAEGEWKWNWNKQVDHWHKVTYHSTSFFGQKWRIALTSGEYVGTYKTLGVGVAINLGDTGTTFIPKPRGSGGGGIEPASSDYTTRPRRTHGISVPLPPPSLTDRPSTRR